jgi:hypothetical protein
MSRYKKLSSVIKCFSVFYSFCVHIKLNVILIKIFGMPGMSWYTVVIRGHTYHIIITSHAEEYYNWCFGYNE